MGLQGIAESAAIVSDIQPERSVEVNRKKDVSRIKESEVSLQNIRITCLHRASPAYG
jgi:hypothetical protein